MRAVGAQRHLPAMPGPRLHAPLLQRDRQQPAGHLLAGGDHGVVLARIVQRAQLLAPGDQLVGDAGHGRDHHRHLVPGLHRALHAGGHGADAVQVGDGGAAELHHDAGHGWVGPRGCRPQGRCGAVRGADGDCPRAPKGHIPGVVRPGNLSGPAQRGPAQRGWRRGGLPAGRASSQAAALPRSGVAVGPGPARRAPAGSGAGVRAKGQAASLPGSGLVRSDSSTTGAPATRKSPGVSD